MALFPGDEIVVAWTPDGVPTRQPSRVVQALGLSTTPPTQAPQLPADIIAPSTGPNTQIGKPMVGGMAPAPIASEPDPYRETVRASFNSPQAPAPVSDVAGTTAYSPTKPVSPAGPGVSSSPPRKPVTNADLSRMGTAGGYNAIADANDGVASAAQNTAQAEADAQIKQAVALEERNEAVNAALVKRQQDAEANLKRVNDKTTALGAAREKWANTKIDRRADHPIMAAIAVALGAVGSAMSGRKDGGNPALDMLFKSIDRKVAGQMADLDKAGKALDMRKEEIGELRTHASDQIAMHNMAISAESEKAARQIEALTARSNSDIVKSKGAELVAQVRSRSAEALAAAVDRQLGVEDKARQFEEQKRQHKASIGVQYAGMAQNERHFNKRFGEDQRQFDARMALDEKKLMADHTAAVMAARAKGDETRAKELAELEKVNRESGISDVATGDRLLQPEGLRLMDEASKLEAESAKFKEKGSLNVAAQIRANALAQKAAQLRGDARTLHQFRARNPTEAIEVGELLSSTQDAVNLIDELKALGPNKAVLGKDKYEQAIKTKAKLLTLTLKDAYKTGTLDKGSVEILDQITGGDPTKLDVNSFTTFLGNSDNTEGSLEALAQSLEKRAQNRLKTAGDGYKGVWKATRPKAPDAADKAGDEVRSYKPTVNAVADDDPGFVRELVENSIPVLGNYMEYGRKQTTKNVEGAESSKHFGLPKDAAAKVDQLLAMRGTKLGKSADAVLLGMATDKDPALRAAGLRVLRENAPDLYEQAMKSVPAATRQAESDLSTLANRPRRF